MIDNQSTRLFCRMGKIAHAIGITGGDIEGRSRLCAGYKMMNTKNDALNREYWRRDKMLISAGRKDYSSGYVGEELR